MKFKMREIIFSDDKKRKILEKYRSERTYKRRGDRSDSAIYQRIRM